MMKQSNYETPTAKIICLDSLDILTTSNVGKDGDDFLKDAWGPAPAFVD